MAQVDIRGGALTLFGHRSKKRMDNELSNSIRKANEASSK
jgi:hypothetical protein